MTRPTSPRADVQLREVQKQEDRSEDELPRVGEQVHGHVGVTIHRPKRRVVARRAARGGIVALGPISAIGSNGPGVVYRPRRDRQAIGSNYYKPAGADPVT
jgi:hypothetical protein